MKRIVTAIRRRTVILARRDNESTTMLVAYCRGIIMEMHSLVICNLVERTFQHNFRNAEQKHHRVISTFLVHATVQSSPSPQYSQPRWLHTG